MARRGVGRGGVSDALRRPAAPGVRALPRPREDPVYAAMSRGGERRGSRRVLETRGAGPRVHDPRMVDDGAHSDRRRHADVGADHRRRARHRVDLPDDRVPHVAWPDGRVLGARGARRGRGRREECRSVRVAWSAHRRRGGRGGRRGVVLWTTRHRGPFCDARRGDSATLRRRGARAGGVCLLRRDQRRRARRARGRRDSENHRRRELRRVVRRRRATGSRARLRARSRRSGRVGAVALGRRGLVHVVLHPNRRRRAPRLGPLDRGRQVAAAAGFFFFFFFFCGGGGRRRGAVPPPRGPPPGTHGRRRRRPRMRRRSCCAFEEEFCAVNSLYYRRLRLP
mmetsp:Transcript_13001/g.52053  ORF Transcript_13001/g.52053 Transcript_13001/m.52053 type:complete len:339 (-) Transcript_13001:732-1748(-)